MLTTSVYLLKLASVSLPAMVDFIVILISTRYELGRVYDFQFARSKIMAL